MDLKNYVRVRCGILKQPHKSIVKRGRTLRQKRSLQHKSTLGTTITGNRCKGCNRLTNKRFQVLTVG